MSETEAGEANAIAIGVAALSEHPHVWQRLREDRALLPNAVEEMLRWASSIPYNRRTALHDVELHGQRIAAGDKVSLWRASANRDESPFTDPHTFDIARNPNPHLAFGRGVHSFRSTPDAGYDRADIDDLMAPLPGHSG